VEKPIDGIKNMKTQVGNTVRIIVPPFRLTGCDGIEIKYKLVKTWV
jgi:hypothetical protein